MKKRKMKRIGQEKPLSKKCGRCKIEKPFAEFTKGNGAYGLRGYCKRCCNEYNKKYTASDKRKQREYYNQNKKAINNRTNENTRKITDFYCRKLLYRAGFHRSEITEELIKFKRIEILYYRLTLTYEKQYRSIRLRN